MSAWSLLEQVQFSKKQLIIKFKSEGEGELNSHDFSLQTKLTKETTLGVASTHKKEDKICINF